MPRSLIPNLLAASQVAANLVAAALSFSAVPAHADPTKEDVATAKTYVKTGRALRDDGQHGAALEKFRAAYALVPTPITGLDLANELLENALLIDARVVFLDVAKMPVKVDENPEYARARKVATRQAEALDARIPSLVVRVKGLAQGVGARVMLDGHELLGATIGLARKVDPGAHEVRLEIANASPVVRSVVVPEATVREVEIVVPADAGGGVSTPTPLATPPRSTNTWRTAGFIAAGAGILALGTGGVLGLSAKTRYDESAPFCNEGRCTPEGIDIRDEARSRGTFATIVMGAGAVLAVSGVVIVSTTLFSATPTTRPARVGVVVGPYAIGFRADF
jgi:hypothetical protein